MSDVDSTKSKTKKTSFEKWYMLFLFSMCTMISACGWICFAPIFNLVQDLYDVNLLTVNYMSLSYCFFFLPMNFPSTYVLDKYGLRIGLLWGITLTAIGLWIRCLVNYSFWFAIAGQTVMAIG